MASPRAGQAGHKRGHRLGHDKATKPTGSGTHRPATETGSANKGLSSAGLAVQRPAVSAAGRPASSRLAGRWLGLHCPLEPIRRRISWHHVLCSTRYVLASLAAAGRSALDLAWAGAGPICGLAMGFVLRVVSAVAARSQRTRRVPSGGRIRPAVGAQDSPARPRRSTCRPWRRECSARLRSLPLPLPGRADRQMASPAETMIGTCGRGTAFIMAPGDSPGPYHDGRLGRG